VNNTQRRHIFIMAGGKGERFWPQSRASRPKHLLSVVGEKPLLAQTLDRLGELAPPENIWVVTAADQRDAALALCPHVPPAQIIGEPLGRDTAAVAALAAMLAERKTPSATLAMLPADAVIGDTDGFRKTLAAAFAATETDATTTETAGGDGGDVGRLVTIGIVPTFPATGYGYIRKGAQLPNTSGGTGGGGGDDGGTSDDVGGGGGPVFAAQRFTEKPDAADAAEFLRSGEYLWNAGMFVWTTAAIAAEFERHEPELWRDILALRTALDAGADIAAALAETYPKLKKISVDRAILEKAANIVCIPAAFDWDDAGAWTALARHFPTDANGNTRRGETAVLDASRNIIISEGGHLIAALGVDDLVIVHTPDATLVCPRHRAQDIKQLVALLPEKFTR
jgi:mannose-1-phosphate guanylyltransferase